MANKEYQMLFRLGAKLGENFNGTFSSAQKVLQTTQKEIQSLNKLQSDVNAYQRQQQSIEKTNERLELYKRQLERVQQEISAAGAKTADQANREDELKLRIKNTTETIELKNRRLAEMGSALSQAGVNVNDLTAESQRLGTQMSELRQQEERAAAEAANFGNSGATAFEAVGSALVSAGIAAGLGKIKDAYNECIGVAMEFGGTMSTVEALSGANAREMAELSQTAKDLGANTAYTANQSAQAMTYMGMAGWDAQQMISGMDGVLNLAAAGGEDLATTSDIVTDNLTAFGLKAYDTAHFADVLAAAATNSNTSVGIMGETFSGSASIAGALGYTIEDVSMAIGLMANAGVKGSVAGTALKNTFNGLLNGATLTAAAFGEVEYTAINADGTMKSFGDTCNELRGYFSQMTEAERVQNAMVLAGQRGYNGLLAILNATDEDYQKLSDSINNCAGSAQRMANIKLDNLQGDVTLLNSAADGLKMTIGGMYDKELRQLAQLGTKILGGINEFCEKNPAVVKALMAGTAALGVFVTGYMALNTVKKVKNALDTASTALLAKNAAAATANAAATGAEAAATTSSTIAHKALNLTLTGARSVWASLTSPIGKAALAIAGVTATLKLARELSSDVAFEERELNTATKEQERNLFDLRVEYYNAVDAYGEADDRTRALKYDVDEATAAYNAQKFTVKDLYNEIDALHSSYGELMTNINAGTTEVDNNYESAQILIAKLRELTSSSDKSAASQAKIEPIIKRLNEIYPSLGLTVDNVADKMDGLNDSIEKTAKTSGWEEKVKAAKENLPELYRYQTQLKEAYDKASTAYTQAGENLSNELDKNHNFIGFAIWNQFVSKTIPDAEEELDKATEEMYKAQNDYFSNESKIKEYEDILEEYGEIISGTSDETVSAYDAMKIATNSFSESAQALIQTYNDAYQAAYDSLSGQYALWDEAAEIDEYGTGDINDALTSQAKYWSAYNANLDTLAGKYDEIEGLRELVASFADGSKDSVDMIAGLTAEDVTNDDLKAIVENWKNVRAEQEKTAGSLAETKTDFQKQLDELVYGTEDSMTTMINGMNLSDEAKAAASDTIQAYADGIKSGMGSVEDAATLVSNAAKKALGVAADVDSESDGAMDVTAAPMTSTNTDISSATNVGSTMGPQLFGGFTSVLDNMHGYAVGTYNAEAGLAMVGERGPELVNFNGGEQVLTAEKTNAILSRSSSGGGNTITIAPVFQISGNMDSDTLRQCADQLVEMVKDALREEGIDERRGAYV